MAVDALVWAPRMYYYLGRDPGGTQRRKAFRRKTDAEGYAASVDMRSGSYIDPAAGRLLTCEWARDWLAAQGHLTPSTYDRYRGAIKNYIVPRWGTTRLASVRHAEVQKWVTQLGATFSPSSVDKVHRVFSQVMSWAVTDDRITKNPAAGIRIRRPALPDHLSTTCRSRCSPMRARTTPRWCDCWPTPGFAG